MAIAISLLVPCYNAAKYLPFFFERLHRLEGEFDEVIFYDDASIDETKSILANSGFKFITGETNQGPGYARNLLAKHAQHTYIHFHDVDDDFNARFLPLLKKKLADTAYDIVLGYADWIDVENQTIQTEWRYDEDEMAADPLAYFLTHPLGIINTVYRKSVFMQIGGFNEKIRCWEDSDLHVRLAASDYKFGVIDEILAYSIRHLQGISSDQDWCNVCRFNFLKLYLADFDRQYHKVIIAEVMKISVRFFEEKNWGMLQQCVVLCRQYGTKLPLTNNPILRYLKQLGCPASTVYRLQKFSRRL